MNEPSINLEKNKKKTNLYFIIFIVLLFVVLLLSFFSKYVDSTYELKNESMKGSNFIVSMGFLVIGIPIILLYISMMLSLLSG